MKVNDVVMVRQEVPSHLQRIRRIINSILRSPPESRKVHNIAGDPALAQEVYQRHNMRLHAAMWGRIGPKLKDLHPRHLLFFTERGMSSALWREVQGKRLRLPWRQVLLGAALKCMTMLACSIGRPRMKGDVSATWSPMNTVKLIRGRVLGPE